MIYFDEAATSRYKPFAVKKAVLHALKHSANPGRGSHKDALRGATLVEETRDEIANFLHAKKADVIFTKNCTEALNLAILGTARLGGHIVTTVLEHNSVLRPLTMLQKEGLVSFTAVEGDRGEIRPEHILSAITEKTYMIAVTAMSNVTGYAPPLREIGKIAADHGIKLLVDGAQAVGQIPIDCDEIGIDLLAGAGHKGLHGMMGTGFLLCNRHAFVNPLMYGGTGTESANLRHPSRPPESLEAGTLNLPGIAALNAGLRWTEKRFEKNNAKIERISRYLHKELRERDIETFSTDGSPLLTFRIKGFDSAGIADFLDKTHDIAIRPGLHCAPLVHRTFGTEKGGLARVSIGAHNTIGDAKKLLSAIDELRSTR